VTRGAYRDLALATRQVRLQALGRANSPRASNSQLPPRTWQQVQAQARIEVARMRAEPETDVFAYRQKEESR
jgi:hypothetical protein